MDLLNDHPVLLAGAIFLARVTDVSLGTFRTILIFRAYRFLAAAIGFVEIIIWIAAAGLVLTNLGEWYLVVAYGGGFAVGTFVGVSIESKLAMGQELLRVISVNREIQLADQLRASGYDVIEIPGTGKGATPVEVLLVVESRRRMPALLERVSEVDPDAVWTITDVRRRAPMLPRRLKAP